MSSESTKKYQKFTFLLFKINLFDNIMRVFHLEICKSLFENIKNINTKHQVSQSVAADRECSNLGQWEFSSARK